jgi:striatin 1/3/4
MPKQRLRRRYKKVYLCSAATLLYCKITNIPTIAKAKYTSILDIDSDPKDPETSAEVDKSRKYLTKCVEEITYLLLPPSHPPPPQQSMGNSSTYFDQQEPQMTMEEVFLQHRQRAQQANSIHVQPPNHQPGTVPSSEPVQQAPIPHLPQQAEFMQREPSSQPLFPPSSTLLSSSTFNTPQSQGSHGESYRGDEAGEALLQQYRSYGQPLSRMEDEQSPHLNNRTGQDSREGFVFGSDAPILTDDQPGTTPTTRPDRDQFPNIPVRSPPRTHVAAHRRKSSGSIGMIRRRSQDSDAKDLTLQSTKSDPGEFKVRFALRGHLDVVRSVIFTGGGSPSEPEVCSAGDDGMIKRWIIPASYSNFGQHGPPTDLDISSYFTHRGHDGIVTSLAAAPATANFSTGGRASGDGWIFSGGQDATVRVWERGRVDPKATLEGHTDAVWALCVLPGTCASVLGPASINYPGDRILIASGSADGTVKVWAVSAPPQLASPQVGSRRGVGSRRHSVTSGSNYPSSPQPSTATTTPFHYTLVHSIERPNRAAPTCISPLSPGGENFVVSFNDSSIVIYDTRTAEEIIGMASNETYDGTPATAVNAVVVTSLGLEGNISDINRGLLEDENMVHGATGSSTHGGIEGVVISGHEDQFIRFFDANSGKLRLLFEI